MTEATGLDDNGLDIEERDGNKDRSYKEFTEERAKKLYAELFSTIFKEILQRGRSSREISCNY